MKFLFFLFLLTLWLTGCGSFTSQQTAALHDFGVQPTQSLSESAPASTPTQLTVDAPNWLMDDFIHYRLLYANPTQVRYYSLDRWIAPPTDLLKQSLASKNQWGSQPISIKLMTFEQQFISAKQANVIINLSVTIESDHQTHRPRASDFFLQLSCPSPDAKGAISAFSALIKVASDRINSWLLQPD